jgi:hypothetical protein
MHPLNQDFWPKFWKIYGLARHADAGNLHRDRWNRVAADGAQKK